MRTYGDADERGGDFAAVFAKKLSSEVDKLIELIMTAQVLALLVQKYRYSVYLLYWSEVDKLIELIMPASSSVPQVYVCSDVHQLPAPYVC
jgi:hypothetical protein